MFQKCTYFQCTLSLTDAMKFVFCRTLTLFEDVLGYPFPSYKKKMTRQQQSILSPMFSTLFNYYTFVFINFLYVCQYDFKRVCCIFIVNVKGLTVLFITINVILVKFSTQINCIHEKDIESVVYVEISFSPWHLNMLE